MADRYDYDPEAFDFAMPKGETRPEEAAKFVRGASYAPFDLLGAPVDIANLLMGGAGGTKPVGGSEFLIDKYADVVEAFGGSYDRPTYDTSETVGRLVGGVTLDPGLAMGIGRMFAKSTKTRGSGIEVKGSGNAELEASSSDLGASGPMVREAGSDVFVPLEKKAGEPGTPGVERSVNPAVDPGNPYKDVDYLPAANALIENPSGMNIGKKGLTGEQYLARLKNQPGVTNTELETSGLASFLRENKNRKMPLEKVYNYHLKNSPNIKLEVNAKPVAGGSQRLNHMPPGQSQYEELVFYDQTTRDDPFLSPAKAPYNLDHFNTDTYAPIAMSRVSHFDDPLTGKRSTIGEEYQSDLQSDLSRQSRGKATSIGSGETLVELSPERVKKFDEYKKALEADPKYRTLPDVNDRMLNAEGEHRMLGQESRNLADAARQAEVYNTGVFDIDEVTREWMAVSGMELPGTGVASPTQKSLAKYALTDKTTLVANSAIFDRLKSGVSGELDDAVKGAVELGIRNRVSDSESKSLLNRVSDSGLQDFKEGFIEQNADQLKALAGAPPELKLTRLTDKEQISSTHSDRMNRIKVEELADLAIATAQKMNSSGLVIPPKVADQIIPDAIKNIDLKRIKRDYENYNQYFKKAVAKEDEAQKAFRQVEALRQERRDIINDAAERVAGKDADIFKQYQYELSGGIAGMGNLDIAKEVRFVPNSPFKTSSQASRYQIHQAIRHAAKGGSQRYYFPDYKDVALVPDRLGNALKRAERDGDTKLVAELEKKAEAYKTTYNDSVDKVIKELRSQYPDIEVGTVNPKDFGVVGGAEAEGVVGLAGMRRIDGEKPMRYIDLTPLQGKDYAVRRYAQGGGVDLRSGIGNIFKLYS